jgi:hypothetical protein
MGCFIVENEECQISGKDKLLGLHSFLLWTDVPRLFHIVPGLFHIDRNKHVTVVFVLRAANSNINFHWALLGQHG